LKQIAIHVQLSQLQFDSMLQFSQGASNKPGNIAAASLTSHNYNLMVFTCKLFPVGEPVWGNNFINYALDMAAWSPAQVRPESRATAGDAPFGGQY